MMTLLLEYSMSVLGMVADWGLNFIDQVTC